MSKVSWIDMLVLGLKVLLGIGIVALGVYMQYLRRMRWSMHHDLLEKTGIQTVLGRGPLARSV